MRNTKKPVAPMVLSIIALCISGLSFISSIGMGILITFPGGGGVHLTMGVLLEIFGFMVCGAFGFFLGIAGAVMGIVAGIVTLVKKRFGIIWMPILSILLGIAATVIATLVLVSISA